MAMKFNRNFDVSHIVKRLVYTILSLYVGGVILTVFGTVMNNTSSGFYSGLSLIGWTVSAGTITSTTSGGVLSVVGIIAIAGIVMEFVSFN
jgi:hypothetical protein